MATAGHCEPQPLLPSSARTNSQIDCHNLSYFTTLEFFASLSFITALIYSIFSYLTKCDSVLHF
jgi:hypothetical protein